MSLFDKKPNVVIMYADDLGFGDVSCYHVTASGAERGARGATTSLQTPNIDRLASEGLLFRQGYATAATCTPSRYSLIAGSYPWRNPRAAILPGDAPQIIPTGSPTMPAMFRKAGYTTGIVGKWHLGLGEGNFDWNSNGMQGTPNDVGFDYSYIMAATNDRVPCVYIDNRHVEGLDPDDPIEVTYKWDDAFPGVPTGRHNPAQLRMKHSHGHDATIVNGVGRIGHMRGGASALWTDETMAEVFAEKAVGFVTENQEQPFFLYYALHQPHVPRLPGPRFKGTTGLGPRGDVIAEMDWCVGEMLDALDRLGLRENTIVIFSSDNGPVLDDGYQDQAEELCGDHKPALLRGGKYSLYDGGTRVPFILSWPGQVEVGETDAMVCHVDFHASFASMVGVSLEDEEAPDSLDCLDALLGRNQHGRDELAVESTQGKRALRSGDWTFLPPHKGVAVHPHTHNELGNAAEPQLYDLSQDIGQVRNVASERPELVSEFSKRLNEISASTQTRFEA